MNRRAIFISIFVLLGGTAAFCDDTPRVPVSIDEYNNTSRATDAHTLPPQVIRTYNIARILDGDLPAAQRIASLKLAEKLGPEDPAFLEALKAVASEAKASAELKQAAADAYMRAGTSPGRGTVRTEPGLQPPALPAEAWPSQEGPLLSAFLDRLAQTGDTSRYVDVVKTWAQMRVDGNDEARFRRAVEKMAGQPWEMGLLTAINSESFFARGSAMAVLAGRFSAQGLAARLVTMTPKTEALAALKTSVTQLGYMPRGGVDLLVLVSLYRLQPNSFADVAKLARQWQSQSGYEFNLRDFHLLSKLTADPIRKILKREELIPAIATSLGARQHLTYVGGAEGSDSFARNTSALSVPDLWNIYLVDQMLTRPRVLLALRVMADRDRADTRSEWGGLIVYESGGAEARLYPPDKDAPPNELKYVPSKQLLTEGRDSMCRFLAHFKKMNNSSHAGPTADELAGAREGNYYGLVLTTLGENEFCAHYFNPQGTVISLGRMAFKF